ncbi:NADH:ubiquinone oxidoreductase subunit NDUFA12 [Tropicimonas sp. IMCC6043]|uniref:NADH:ubiquinone oxidoreductase subunit NDUFA12 n=1 Tax=Tropicimonas sp. IMCC6043 TaxID=2510645 RepID=UPI00101CA5B1|nr:NADH:ubiquinone oxidoreductase subunit NDUFA12 [Tropicimonas sp. IMCC6043]RYH11110.1 NADH:ubiquinone oxidoreductase subunit NDUFA12 [Tropicimonas sp. IMCC6043]
MGILNSVLRALIWWDGQTYGTQLFTSRHGEKVGEDDEGNVYYRNEDDSKRWVVFNGEMEASRIPPDWHGWLHKTFAEPPSQAPLRHKAWEKPHLENVSAIPELSYKPAGSIRRADPVERSDYEAWAPE